MQNVITYNGLTIGTGRTAPFRLVGLDGVDSPPKFRYNVMRIVRKQGGKLQGGGLQERVVAVDVLIPPFGGTDIASQRASYDLRVNQMSAAFAPLDPGSQAALPLGLNGGSYIVNCYPEDLVLPREKANMGIMGVAKVTLIAEDPYIYSNPVSSATTGLQNIAGTSGFNFPFSFPFAMGSGLASGIVSVTNTGNVKAPCVFTIQGPCANPVVENLTTGQYLQLAGTFAASDTITLDTNAETVVLSSSASRYDLLSHDDWFGLVPGVNQIRFRADAYQSAASLLVSWRSANLSIGG